jgi:hypothetical protein
MAMSTLLKRMLALAAAIWNFAIVTVCALYGRELFLNRIDSSRNARVFALVVFAGMTVQAMSRARERLGEFFRLK